MLDSSVITIQSVSAGEYAPPPADRPPTAGARAAEHAVALPRLVADRGGDDLGADELQRAGVAQSLEPIKRRERLAPRARRKAATLGEWAFEERGQCRPHSRTVAP